MGADRIRVLALAIVALALVVVSTWVLDWFSIKIEGIALLSQLEYFGIGLRDVTFCDASTCESASLSQLPKSLFSTLAAGTVWSCVGFALLIAIQAGMRTVTGQATDALTKIGYAVGIVCFGCAFLTAFFFNPEVGSHGLNAAGNSFSAAVQRTWAPHLLMLGIVVGFGALHYAVHHDTLTTHIAEPPVLPAARALTAPLPTTTARISTPIPRLDPAHEALVGKLRYAMSQAEITRGGIDARREDRSNVLVMWRDVVGVVARRMPATHDNIAFADLVSSAGSTLRLVPWTRLSGDPLDGDGEHRVRAFVELVVARCPEVRVDRATREFLDGKAPPAQLPDLETLAVHDGKLA